MRVLVTGGRDYTNGEAVIRELKELPSDAMVITGGARGADMLAETTARRLGLDVIVVYANWTRHGNSAGPRRNNMMFEIFNPDLVLSFPGGAGTRHCTGLAHFYGVPVKRIED